MQLRLRSLESEDTLEQDVPDPCSLPQLRRILADRLPPPPPGSSSSLRLSLNCADELRSPGPADSLRSLGLASGDLVYYSLGPGGFASSRGDGNSSSPDFSAGASSHQVPGGRPAAAVDSEMTDPVAEGARKIDASGSAGDGGDSASGSVDFDGRGVLAAVGRPVVVRSKLSEPYFLFKRVLTERVSKEELGRCGGKVIVMAVHAVMQESGFVAVDPPAATGMPADPLCGNPVSLWYCLPELVARSQGLNMPESVALTFQSPGHFITVYGSLARANLGLPRVLAGFRRVCCLDMRSYAPTVELMRMWAKGDSNDVMEADEDGGFWSSYPVKRMFEFWRIVKHHLALPLLRDLAESVGLSLPSYFTCLPAELKLKIFESLSGVDLAKVGCVCSELWYLTSSNDLWKQKYMDEFKRKRRESQGMIDWKQRFARSWKRRIGRYSYRRRFRRWMQRRREEGDTQLVADPFTSGQARVRMPCDFENYSR